MLHEAAVPRNKILCALPPADLRQLTPRLELVRLKPRRILLHARLPIEHVYFVESGLVSAVADADVDTQGTEAWLIGPEGLVGVPVLHGVEASPHCRLVQAGGWALRMSTADLRQAMQDLPTLQVVLLRYVNSLLIQAGQVAACNARHPLPQRLARWLLVALALFGRDELPLTHAGIGRMLGVRRASVTTTFHVLASSGGVSVERGLIHILDRAKLEHLTCGCHRTLRTEFDRLSLPLAPRAVQCLSIIAAE